jgi:nitrate/TMAO reductase-like tetraheme cytochrome c subunit
MEGYKMKGTRRFSLESLSRSTTGITVRTVQDNRITLCKQELWRMETRQANTCGICQHLSPQELSVTCTQASLIRSQLNKTSLKVVITLCID